MNPAYYNEFDPFAADWLRNLIAAGHIAPGDVDERSIEDVHPDDLRNYTQCHFFAGIGVWSYALRAAGWPDNRPVWTGSCPCQPFSAAGKGSGFDDERHLWPHFHWLIRECRPSAVFGEQVASSDVSPWIDLVQADMEALAYAFAAVAFPSASVGAPHIRDRTYWVAHTPSAGLERRRTSQTSNGRDAARLESERLCNALRLAHAGQHSRGRQAAPTDHIGAQADRPTNWIGGRGGAPGGMGNANSQSTGRDAGGAYSAEISDGTEHGHDNGLGHAGGSFSGLADANGGNASTEREQRRGQQRQQPQDGGIVSMADATGSGRRKERPDDGRIAIGDCAQGRSAGSIDGGSDLRPGPVNGFWRNADWLLCRDGKWRPVEPGTFPLAHGATARVGRLRAYGNAINAEAAITFIKASMK